MDEFLEYDIATDTWTYLFSNPFEIGPRGSFGMTPIDTAIFAFGGGGGGMNHNDVWKYTPPA